jgi:hypothetical protein
MKPVFRYAAALALAGATPLAAAQVRITEYLYDGASKEFVEITNVGTTPVDLTGWSYDDDSNVAGSVPIGALGTLAVGESAIIAENTADAFRTAWGLCAAAKVVGGSTHNLGRADTINLYDASGTRVDTLRYGDQTFPGTIRAQNASGWVSAAGLGNDQIAQWTLSVVGDAENSRLSASNEIGSPGLSTRAAQPYNPCQPLGPRMRITEYMYDSSANGEFVEFTNVGDAPADMAGWSFDDDSNAPGTVALGAFGTVQPGESVLFTDQAAASFRTAWGLCAGVKVVGGNTVGLGRNDVINLYDATNQQVDKLAYGDQTFPGSIRTTGASGWVSATGLGANLAAQWTLSTVGDAEGSIAATGGAIGSPGKSTRALFDYDACVGVGGAPVVTVDVGATTRRLDLPVNGAGSVAATIGDATDPAATAGIVFHFADTDGDVAALTVIATSSNSAVVADGGLTWTGTGADRTLRIAPAGAAGYATITVRATDADNKAGTYTINYAASLGAAATDRNYTGTSDASAGIDAGGGHLLVADDENQNLRLYSRTQSGLAENGFDVTASLALTDIDGGVPREVDLEGAARDGTTVYWTGSHSNKKDNGAARPNRQRVFATTLTGAGDAAQLAYAGRYDHLRTDLVAWDANNGHGLGANALGLTASAAIGVWPERDDGFNIEGLALAPDTDGLYIAFRAPLLPVNARAKALVIHATNLRAVVRNAPAGGSQAAGSVTFAAPIELDLGGRGIREIVPTSDGRYLIVAGPTAGATGTPPSNFQLYLWSGNATDTSPLPLNANLAAVAAAGSVETLIGAASVGTNVLTFLSDSGDTVWYADGVVAKDLAEPRIRKFVGVDVTVDVPPANDVIFRNGFEVL